MDKICEELYKIGIVPVIAIDDAKDAEPLAKALINGGLPAAEITFRTAAAEDAIRIISEKFPQMIVGAGTVLNKDQADRAKKAGAKFIVSPGFNRSNVEYIMSLGVPVVPGCATPGEVEQAIELGLDCVKFFPAEQNGGIAMIGAMAAPYGNMHFMPTGGINLSNINDYLSFDKVFCCGGSWMVKKDLISAGKFDEIEKMTRAAVKAMLRFTVEAKDGHLEATCKNLDRAVYHLKRQGASFDESSFKYDEKGKLIAAALADGTHLVKK